MSGAGCGAALRRATALVELGRHGQAIPLLGDVLAAEPDHAAAHRMLAMCLRAVGRDREAADAAGRALALEPGSAVGHRVRSMTLFSKDPLGALEAAQQAARLEPHNHRNFVAIGQAQLMLKDYAAAGAAAEQAISLAPDEALPYVLRAMTLLKAGQRAAARGWFEQALRTDPGNAVARGGLAATEFLRLRFSAAIKGFMSVAAADPASGAVEPIEQIGLALLTLVRNLMAPFSLGLLAVAALVTDAAAVRATAASCLVLWAALGTVAVRQVPSGARQYLLRLPRRKPRALWLAVLIALAGLGAAAALLAGVLPLWPAGALALIPLPVSAVTEQAARRARRAWRVRAGRGGPPKEPDELSQFR